jgi:hypothetical protein
LRYLNRNLQAAAAHDGFHQAGVGGFADPLANSGRATRRAQERCGMSGSSLSLSADRRTRESR